MKRVRKRKYTSKLIQILLCTTAIVACITLSKYQATEASKATAQVAKVSLEANINEIILEDMEPGDTKSYYFEVGSTKARDVELKYTIKLDSGSNLPLSFEVRKVETEAQGETTEVLGENLLKTGNVTDEIDMPIEDNAHKYKLIVSWDETQDSYEFSTEIDYVDIIINAYQVNVN